MIIWAIFQHSLLCNNTPRIEASILQHSLLYNNSQYSISMVRRVETGMMRRNWVEGLVQTVIIGHHLHFCPFTRRSQW
uniref:Uncharacterized protein n=1 Tax=Arion vulgaris TaxID=1028688 RepID=A0A0B7AVT2_9EUPU